ncbi:MAG: DUF1854 domain-containing protein [Chitinivibrionales bacterium]
MNALRAESLSFERNLNGFLDMVTEGSTYSHVQCIQLFPLSDPRRYIAVSHMRGATREDIGIIIDMNALSSSARELVTAEISTRYFVPEILSIRSISKAKGAHPCETWNVETDRGDKTFQLASPKENVTIIERGTVFIIDTEKCRYKITDYQALPGIMREKVEKYLS